MKKLKKISTDIQLKNGSFLQRDICVINKSLLQYGDEFITEEQIREIGAK